ncbi:MAG: hypothetical protein HC777_02275 [Hyphomonadaceae bacterium]|nr:hypothetical protein [Hyphomonadaceae bacterium]
MSIESRYYNVLGAAYEVPLETARFDAFLDSAMAFFFPEPQFGTLAADVPRFGDDDEALDHHARRIGALVEAACRKHIAPTDRFHAELKVSILSKKVTGMQLRPVNWSQLPVFN